MIMKYRGLASTQSDITEQALKQYCHPPLTVVCTTCFTWNDTVPRAIWEIGSELSIQ